MITKVISGGQSGVDRAGLDAALDLGIPHGGFCPRGRRAEDGPIAGHYQLTETESTDYPPRTELNVENSDGTLIVYRPPLRGGTGFTAQACRLRGKPLFLVDLDQPLDVDGFWDWIRLHRIHTLNIAGPRESQAPGIYSKAKERLAALLAERRVAR